MYVVSYYDNASYILLLQSDKVYCHLGDKPTERQKTRRQSNWASANWATHFSQLGDNIGRVIQHAYVGRNVHK